MLQTKSLVNGGHMEDWGDDDGTTWEVALRAAINNELSVAFGPHFYLNPRSFEQPARQREFLKKVLDARYFGNRALLRPV